ncbi:MAG: HlyD family efflux transporter periplasmic adaptor subunit [Acidobacteria bacterium]|nr:MAG: HlyD family efflux transporter periplasmic adaptor subunit [Acidobacteriota bacterium]
MSMTRKKKVVLIVTLVVALSAIIGFSVNARRKDQITVQMEKITLRDKLISKVSSTGEIKPKEYVELQSEIAGVITVVYVKEGDVVQKGDLLLRIDPTQNETEARAQKSALDIAQSDATNQLAQISLQETNVNRDRSNLHVAEAELQRAEKSAEIAEASFKRKQELFEQNLISRDLYDAAKNELVTAQTLVVTSKARVEQAKAQLAVTEVVLEQTKNTFKSAEFRVTQNRAYLARTEDMLSKTVIRSPLTGVITKLNVEKGERAVPGTLNSPMATLMEIADLSVIEAEVEVDETDIVNVKVGQDAEVKVDALRDKILKGKVTEVGNSAISTTTTSQEAKDFKVVVQVDNPPQSLRPGLSCVADITTAVRANVLVIPMQALTIREFEVDKSGKLIKPAPEKKDKGKVVKAAEKKPTDTTKKAEKKEFQGVFIVKNDKAEFVEVKTGVSGDTDIEVLSGLKPGTEIVTGTFKTLRTLKDGDSVKKENGKKG